jgi:hypothetical protein
MVDTPNRNNSAREATPADRSATHEEILAAKLPPQVKEQPDPMLQLSVGRVGAGSLTLVGVVAAIILGVVLYGLNSPAPNAGAPASAASAPAAGGKTGAAGPGGQQTGNTSHS